MFSKKWKTIVRKQLNNEILFNKNIQQKIKFKPQRTPCLSLDPPR